MGLGDDVLVVDKTTILEEDGCLNEELPLKTVVYDMYQILSSSNIEKLGAFMLLHHKAHI